MKKMICGMFFMIIGFLGMFIPIILAAPFVPDTNYWEYKLWNIIFSRKYFDMAFFFGAFLLIFAIGFVILLKECFPKNKISQAKNCLGEKLRWTRLSAKNIRKINPVCLPF